MRAACTALLLVLSLFAAGGIRAQMTPFAVPLQRAGFEKIDRRHGVTVYGHEESRMLHFAAEARFTVPPDQVLQALLAYERHVGRIGRLSESRVLQRRAGSLVVYQRLNLPVIDDRDYTLQVRWGQLGDVRWITFRALPRGPPLRQGVVRVTHHAGSWQLRPVSGGRRTLARYQMLIDLAGWVPMWMAGRPAGKEVSQVFVELENWLSYHDPGLCKADADCILRLCCCKWRALKKGAPAPPICARRCRCKFPPKPHGVRCEDGRCKVIR